jgi:hypothetical protein
MTRRGWLGSTPITASNNDRCCSAALEPGRIGAVVITAQATAGNTWLFGEHRVPFGNLLAMQVDARSSRRNVRS